ncbi:MAG: serine/threonine protein kinase [Planctomycetes bacterium]|nr:serine/threonine protein kinase [Planctomycetota bacterium]
MQIRCAGCARTVAIADTGVLPASCPFCQQSPAPARLGRYAIERLLAAGGMGEVYLANDTENGAQVAIKLLPPPIGDGAATVRERFAREARLQQRLDHPGIVRVLDADVAGDRPWLVLEFVRGQSLRQRLRAGPLPVADALRWCAETAGIVAAAHAHGVLHRDLKPENVMLTDDGQVRVLDFGLARAQDDTAPLTRTGEILGTPEYMAPEQLLDSGDAVDGRTDVHALGVLGYELLTGKSPFHAPNLFAVLKLVESLQPKAPSQLRAGVPPGVDAVLLRAMAKDQRERWPTATAFAAALRGAVAAAPSSLPRRWAWLATALMVLTAVGLWATRRPSRRPDAPIAPFARIDALLQQATRSVAEQGELRAFVQQHERSTDPDQRRRRGLARLHLGEFHAAVTDLDAAGPGSARAPARLAWLCAYVLPPLAIGAPPWWSACDLTRQQRLFGGADDPVPDDDEAAAARLLAEGDARAAWQRLLPIRNMAPGSRSVAAATLALIAAHSGCLDPTVLRTVATTLPDAAPHVRELLALRLLPDDTARITGLRAHADALTESGPDRWLWLLCATAGGNIDPADTTWSHAERGWLLGGGDAAIVWLIAGRLWSWRQGAAEAEPAAIARLDRLLAGSSATEAPAVLVLRALLATARGALTVPDLPGALPHGLQFLRTWTTAATDANAIAVARVLAGIAAGRTDEPTGLDTIPADHPAAATADLLRAWWRADAVAALRACATGADSRSLAAALGHDLPRAQALLLSLQSALPQVPGLDPVPLLRLLLATGARFDPSALPWSTFTAGQSRPQWLLEVCNGIGT